VREDWKLNEWRPSPSQPKRQPASVESAYITPGPKAGGRLLLSTLCLLTLDFAPFCCCSFIIYYDQKNWRQRE
jgi:hypothetical protein